MKIFISVILSFILLTGCATLQNAQSYMRYGFGTPTGNFNGTPCYTISDAEATPKCSDLQTQAAEKAQEAKESAERQKVLVAQAANSDSSNNPKAITSKPFDNALLRYKWTKMQHSIETALNLQIDTTKAIEATYIASKPLIQASNMAGGTDASGYQVKFVVKSKNNSSKKFSVTLFFKILVDCLDQTFVVVNNGDIINGVKDGGDNTPSVIQISDPFEVELYQLACSN